MRERLALSRPMEASSGKTNRDGTPIESREIDKNMRRYYNNWIF